MLVVAVPVARLLMLGLGLRGEDDSVPIEEDHWAWGRNSMRKRTDLGMMMPVTS